MREALYVGGGLAAGWLIGKMLFGDKSLKVNPGWSIHKMPKYSDSYRVAVDGRGIGYVWGEYDTDGIYQALTNGFEVISAGHGIPDDAAEVVFQWALEHGEIFNLSSRPLVPSTKRAQVDVSCKRSGSCYEPIAIGAASKPIFGKEYDIWSTESTDRFIVMHDVSSIGHIEGYGTSYDAYVDIRGKRAAVALGVTKINAIGAVVAVDLIMRFLRSQRDYTNVSFRLQKYYELTKTVSMWRPRLVAARDISEETGIPLKLVEAVGKFMAENGLLFGVSGRIRRPGVAKRQEMIVPIGEEAQRAKSRRRRGRKTSIKQRRRRIVAAQDDSDRVRKMQAGLRKEEGVDPVLTKEEIRSLPRAGSVLRYSFALYGPDGSLGMFEAGSRKVKKYLEEDWTVEGRKQFLKRLEQREKAAIEEASAQTGLSREKAADLAKKPGIISPYAKSEEEALRELLAKEEWEVAGQFFEEKRLEGLDFVSRRRQDREGMMRRVDGARKVVSRLEKELNAAHSRHQAAIKAGHQGRAMQASETMTKKESQLTEARERLEDVEAEMARFGK